MGALVRSWARPSHSTGALVGATAYGLPTCRATQARIGAALAEGRHAMDVLPNAALQAPTAASGACAQSSGRTPPTQLIRRLIVALKLAVLLILTALLSPILSTCPSRRLLVPPYKTPFTLRPLSLFYSALHLIASLASLTLNGKVSPPGLGIYL